MEISLVIPSTPNHFVYIDCILNKYENGTVKPDEVIISVSNGDQLNRSLVESLEAKYKNSFNNLKFILNDHKVMEGPNRGVGSKHSSCEYITYHDSDDIPHPQRIEIIKHVFNKYDILHLNHSYSFDQKFDKISLEDIVCFDSEKVYKTHFGDGEFSERPLNFFPHPNDKSYGAGLGIAVCGGPTTIHRSVLDKVKWNQDRILSYDYDFCMDTLFTLRKSMIINSPLIWYNKIGNANWACR